MAVRYLFSVPCETPSNNCANYIQVSLQHYGNSKGYLSIPFSVGLSYYEIILLYSIKKIAYFYFNEKDIIL